MFAPPSLYIRAAFGERPAARYLRFFEEGEFAELTTLKLRSGALEGTFRVRFDEFKRLLALGSLEERAGLDQKIVRDWLARYPRILPFAFLDKIEPPGDCDEASGALLVVSFHSPLCPVYVLAGVQGLLFPLAPSLDAFVRGRAWRASPLLGIPYEGPPYSAFSWMRVAARARVVAHPR